MNSKKSRDANLEKLRLPLLLLGVMCASAFALVCFEWRTFTEEATITEMHFPSYIDDEYVFAALPESQPKKPKPPIQKEVIDQLLIVDDHKIDLPFEELSIDLLQEPVIENIPQLSAETIEEPYVSSPSLRPEFPGGLDSLQKFLGSHIHYPARARDVGIQGKVYVEFIVNTQGHIENPRILRGIGGECDEEALRVVKMMPTWTPGQQGIRKVNVLYRLPISYKLQK